MSLSRPAIACIAVLPAVLIAACLAFSRTKPPAPAPVKVVSVKLVPCPAERQMAGGGCGCESETNWNDAVCTVVAPTTRRRVGTMVMGTDLHSDNCVFFVRDRVRSLPFGLGTWKGKLAIINAPSPRVGDVALIAIASGVYQDVGHVAIIEAVSENAVTILEANYYAGQVSRRTATGRDVADAAGMLGIAGYFRP